MSTQRSICPKCKGGPFPSGASFSIHLSWCKSPGTVWDNFSHGEENYNRLLSEATIPTTLTQRINAVSRDMKRPHIEGTTRNSSLLSSMPSIAQLAMAPSHPDALAIEFAHSYNSDTSFHVNNEDSTPQTAGLPDSFDKLLFECDLPPSVIYQIHMEHVLRSHRDVDLSLLDDINSIVHLHLSRGVDLKNSKIYPRKQLVKVLTNAFNMKGLKPKIVKVPISNGFASVAVFDVKAQLLSLLHDPSIMKEENFAKGYDIFSGLTTEDSTQYGEVHTGWAFEQARAAFCGDDPDAFPLPLALFYDKTYVDIHGSLSCSPAIAWPCYLNRTCRGQIKCARVLCYVPNLSYGKGKANRQKPVEKLNVEHACLRTVMEQLAEIQSAGGFWTMVMDKRVKVVPWLHMVSGDIVGQNDLTGHFNAHGNTANPHRHCHCPPEEMDNPSPKCTLVTMDEVNLAYLANDVTSAFKAMSKHPIRSCFAGVPIACQVSGIFGSVPPCVLHTIGGGILKYQFECTSNLIGPGQSKQKEKEKFDVLHQNLALISKRQSDNKMPRGSIR